MVVWAAWSSGWYCAGSVASKPATGLAVDPARPSLRPGRTEGATANGATRAAALLVAGPALSACGAGAGTSKASGSDRAATAGGCVNVSGEVASTVNVGVRLGAQSLPPAQAKARLQPILAKVSAVAQQNAALPVGPKLQSLGEAITKAENANPTIASQLRSAASDIALPPRVSWAPAHKSRSSCTAAAATARSELLGG